MKLQTSRNLEGVVVRLDTVKTNQLPTEYKVEGGHHHCAFTRKNISSRASRS